MLPEPTLTLTLPSVHDGLTLDCRRIPTRPWGAATTILWWRLLLDSFCARDIWWGRLTLGAHGSAGKTSWTSKPERDDYATFVAFILHYVHYLDPFRPQSADSLVPSQPSSPTKAVKPLDVKAGRTRPILLMGGYSYGAMITTQLPPLDAILQPFVAPIAGSDAAEVRLRAAHLAEQQNVVLASARAAMLEHGSMRGRSKRGVRIGGDEGGSPRRSHDSHGRRSFSLDAEDKIRRGVHELMAKARSGRHSQRLFHSPSEGQSSTAVVPPPPGEHLPAILDLTMPRPAYFVISPLQGLVTHLATMSLVPSALVKNKGPHDVAAEEKLVWNPTMAVFGDTDVFVAAHRLRSWTGRMEERNGSMFKGCEVTTAGHFWVEEGVLDKMRDVVGGFAEELLTGVNGHSHYPHHHHHVPIRLLLLPRPLPRRPPLPPSAPSRNGAAIIICQPWTSIKEQSPANYAHVLAPASFICLAFDAAYQGESEGQPRGLEDPYHRVEDIKCAVTYLTGLDGVDSKRIGILGICASGGYAAFAAQEDIGIKACATLAAVCVGTMARRGFDKDSSNMKVLHSQLEAAAKDRDIDVIGEKVDVVHMVPEKIEDIPDDFPESWDIMGNFDAFAYDDMISQRLLMMIAGTKAATRWYSGDAINKAKQPKELVVL
ncbi:hypothetical protein ACJ41O_007138 [Fusarium nematophilum]